MHCSVDTVLYYTAHLALCTRWLHAHTLARGTLQAHTAKQPMHAPGQWRMQSLFACVCVCAQKCALHRQSPIELVHSIRSLYLSCPQRC